MEKTRRFFSEMKGLSGYLRLNKVRNISVGKILEKQAGKRPDKNLILFEGREITYREFNEAANRYSHLFLERGFNKGDTVALFMDNRPEYLVIHSGLAKIGVVPALVNNNIRGEALARALNIAEAKAVIIGHEYIDQFKDTAADVKLESPGTVFVEKEGKELKTPDGMEDLTPLLASQSSVNPGMTKQVTSKDVLEYIYTSGTTGMPKATVLKHQRWLQLGYATGGYCFKTTSDDVQYCCLPLYHNSGINLAWPTTLMFGGTFALSRKFSASRFWDDIRKYKASIFVYIGELCRYLNNQPKRENDKNNTLRVILGNGMRGDYWEEFQERFGIEKIIEGYGSTEGVGGILNRKGIPGMLGPLTSAGMRFGEVARYDRDTEELLRGKDGYVKKCTIGETGMFLAAINKRAQFSGYKGDKKATSNKMIENVFKQGDAYFISGDLFKLHEKDYVSFVDRLGDTFKWKGEVVATNEVADIINRFGQIEDSNVYGVQVENTEGRAGMAALTLLPGKSLDWKAFSGYIVEKIVVYARPYFIRIRDKVDATSSFKQVKRKLQDEGFDPAVVKDPLYFLDPGKWEYVELTGDLYNDIQGGAIKF